MTKYIYGCQHSCGEHSSLTLVYVSNTEFLNYYIVATKGLNVDNLLHSHCDKKRLSLNLNF